MRPIVISRFYCATWKNDINGSPPLPPCFFILYPWITTILNPQRAATLSHINGHAYQNRFRYTAAFWMKRLISRTTHTFFALRYIFFFPSVLDKCSSINYITLKKSTFADFDRNSESVWTILLSLRVILKPTHLAA